MRKTWTKESSKNHYSLSSLSSLFACPGVADHSRSHCQTVHTQEETQTVSVNALYSQSLESTQLVWTAVVIMYNNNNSNCINQCAVQSVTGIHSVSMNSRRYQVSTAKHTVLIFGLHTIYDQHTPAYWNGVTEEHRDQWVFASSLLYGDMGMLVRVKKTSFFGVGWGGHQKRAARVRSVKAQGIPWL